jgi:hypothetical protein
MNTDIILKFIYAFLTTVIFNEAGVEIMSPHYTQIRDGNKTAIPSEYLPKDYQPSGIRIKNLGNNQPK